MDRTGHLACIQPLAVPDADARWRGMKFGLMMHWGIYSVAGGAWKGKNIPCYNEQIMHRAKVPWAEYLIQPDCRVSGRIWNGYDDFMECGDNETPNFWFDGPWESSVTLFHETWGYRSWQEQGKTT